MNDNTKTKAQLTKELQELRWYIAEKEKSETERKRAEAELAESEGRYRHLVEESFDGIFIQKGPKIIFANKRLYQMLGYQEGELEGLDHWVVYHPDYQPITRERAQARLRGEEVRPQYEVKLQRKDGTFFDGEIRARGIMLGNEPGVQVWVRDISERKWAEEELRIEKERFQTLSEESPFGLVWIDPDGTFRYINSKFRELFGYELSDVPNGKTWFRKAYPNPTYRHQVIGVWLKDLQTFKPGERRHEVFTVTCKDGTEKIINFIPVQLTTTENLMACEDITDRKRAEEELRKSEEKYRFITDRINDVIWTLDANLRPTYVSLSVHKILGFTPEERLRQNLLERVTPASAEKVQEILKSELQRDREKGVDPDRSLTLELEYYHKDGSIVWMEQIVGFIRDGEGNITGVHGVSRNITERRQVEEALQKSGEDAKRLAQENAIMAEIGQIIGSTLNIEEVYERFAERVRQLIPFDRIAINVVNPEGKAFIIPYVLGPDVAEREVGKVVPLAGTGAQWVFQNRKNMVILEENWEKIIGRFPSLLPLFRAGFRSVMMIPLISKDQVIAVLNLQTFKKNAYTDADLKLAEKVGTQIAGAIANAELFTQLRWAEEEVRAREEKFKDLYDSAPVGYYEYDMEGRITNVNRRDLEMLGYSQEEMIGQYIWKFIEGEDIVRQQILEKLQGLRPPGHSLERTFRRKDGSTFPVLIENQLNKDEQGRITGIRSTIQDITERKRVEEELRRAKEAADAANVAKSEFLANMSHELRTPLNHIIGFTELVVDKQYGELNEVQAEYLNDTLQSSRHLLSLINDILDLSKVEAGKLELEVAEIHLRMLLESSLNMVKEKAMGHRIRLLSDMNDIPEAIQADERKLKQILYNLLSNAVKFTPDGGSVILSARYLFSKEGHWFTPDGQPVELPLDGDNLVMKGKGLIHISVQDTGIGIKGEDLQRIFNPFEQADNSASRKYQGSGLGLSLTKRLVELQGGKIWAESEGEGKGSKVILLIPV